MEKYLDRIKELIKKGSSQTPGLFSGNMGICFSLYVINKELKDIEIERIADNLLEKTINEISTMKDVSFDKGLAGIGCAINLLHMNNCIEGDIDDILYNIDATIYKNLCQQNQHHSVDLLNGLIGYLLYIVSRFKNERHKKDIFQNTINESILRIIIEVSIMLQLQ